MKMSMLYVMSVAIMKSFLYVFLWDKIGFRWTIVNRDILLLWCQKLLTFFGLLFLRQHYNSLLLSSLFNAIHQYFYSYDMYERLITIFPNLPLDNPVEEFSAASFFQLPGFSLCRFEEYCTNLT
jgi:hypothetical protein